MPGRVQRRRQRPAHSLAVPHAQRSTCRRQWRGAAARRAGQGGAGQGRAAGRRGRRGAARAHLLPDAAAAGVAEVVHLVQHHQAHVLRTGGRIHINSMKASQQAFTSTARPSPPLPPPTNQRRHPPRGGLRRRAGPHSHGHSTAGEASPRRRPSVAKRTLRRSAAEGRLSSSTRYSMLRRISVVITCGAGCQDRWRHVWRCRTGW